MYGSMAIKQYSQAVMVSHVTSLRPPATPCSTALYTAARYKNDSGMQQHAITCRRGVMTDM